MGNQESGLTTSSYIIKKKNIKQKNINNIQKSQNQQVQYQQHHQHHQQNQNQQIQQIQYQQHHQQNQNQQIQYQQIQYQQHHQQNQNQQKQDINFKKEYMDDSEFKNANSLLIKRNMLPDIYKDKDYINLYPTNSNNELSNPKKNFDDIKFTPYNFNEEISTYKDSINNERVEFEKNEKKNREIFEKNEKKKYDYLKDQIDLFEKKYNPWEILNLQNYDYNIDNIKKAYKKNALKFHPDRAGEKYKDRFQLITQSYIYLLRKAEENNSVNIKINKKVEKAEYEDNINEKVENIYIDKDKFNINQFNKIFEEYKIPSSFDKGYSNLMKEQLSDNDEEIFGKKFNNDIFNAHFDKIKDNKRSTDIIEYNEPNALDSSINNSNQMFLGLEDIDDFGSMNNNNLSYTDYKKAHVDETLLIDINKVKYKTYNSIDQLENDRSNISYIPDNREKERYEYLEKKKIEEDNLRLFQQRNYDNIIKNQYDKLNQRLIINK